MKLVCRLCNLEVSKEVIELKDLDSLNSTDGQDLLPEGFYMVAKDDYYFPLRLMKCIVINIKDLINSNYHSEQRRLNGCCGLDGCDGMNRVCLDNHEIGTERSDCWMPHYIALNPESVIFV